MYNRTPVGDFWGWRNHVGHDMVVAVHWSYDYKIGQHESRGLEWIVGIGAHFRAFAKRWHKKNAGLIVGCLEPDSSSLELSTCTVGGDSKTLVCCLVFCEVISRHDGMDYVAGSDLLQLNKYRAKPQAVRVAPDETCFRAECAQPILKCPLEDIHVPRRGSEFAATGTMPSDVITTFSTDALLLMVDLAMSEHHGNAHGIPASRSVLLQAD